MKRFVLVASRVIVVALLCCTQTIAAVPGSPGDPKTMVFLNDEGLFLLNETGGLAIYEWNGRKFVHALEYIDTRKIELNTSVTGKKKFSGWVYKHPKGNFHLFFSMDAYSKSKCSCYPLAWNFKDDSTTYETWETYCGTRAKELDPTLHSVRATSTVNDDPPTDKRKP